MFCTFFADEIGLDNRFNFRTFKDGFAGIYFAVKKPQRVLFITRFAVIAKVIKFRL